MEQPGRVTRAQWVRVAVCAVAVLLAYYAAPVDWTSDSIGLALLGTATAVAVLAWMITIQIRRQITGDENVAASTLLILVLLVTAVFAWGYYALETARPGEMANLETRTDSLYFTVQVLSTVGLGDVHAVGQAARILATVQMAFDLIFIAAAGTVLAASVRSRIKEAPRHGEPPAGAPE